MSADVIVVGAGVIGAATAFHLSLLDAGEVLVLDRDHVGSGMSSRSSALVRMHYAFGPEVELAVRSDQMFDAWPQLVGAPHCVRRTGFVRIVLPGEEPQLRANVAMQQARGAKVELIDGATLAEVAPGLVAYDVTWAAWEEHGGYGNGSVVAGDMLEAARRGGVGYRPHSAVRSLLRRGDRVVGVETDAGAELAGTVVLAAGVWSPPLLAGVGLRLPIEGELHHVAVLKHEVGRGARVACIDSTTQTYFRPEGSPETTLVGAFAGSPIDLPDSAPPGPDPEELAAIAASASRRVPALQDAGITGGVIGVYDMTPDARPLLGIVPGLDGLVVAAGFSGMGFKISPAVGEALAELVTTGDSTRVDLRPFRPSRFDEGEPISPPFPYSDD